MGEHQQYQQQQSTEPSQIQAYDQYPQQQQEHGASSQIQPYDQSTQAAYYGYQYNPQDYNQQYQYPYYPPQGYYSNAYQQQQYQPDNSSIHPPGVSVPPASHPYATQQQQPQYSYVPQQQQIGGVNYGEVATVTMPNVAHTPAKCLVTRVGIPEDCTGV